MRCTTSLLLEDGVTKVTTINISNAIDPFTVECIWHDNGGWKTPSKPHRFCLRDSLTLWNKQTNLPPSTRMRSGPTACHVVMFLCLCFNFIWTKAFKSSILSLCSYSVTFCFFVSCSCMNTKRGYCNIFPLLHVISVYG